MQANKNNESEIVYSEKELRQMREDDLFQERFWKDEYFDDSPLEPSRAEPVKAHIYGSDPIIDKIIDELKRLKNKRK